MKKLLMKKLLFLTCCLACTPKLVAYSNIPEGTTTSKNSYSNISSYSNNQSEQQMTNDPFPSNKDTDSVNQHEIISENSEENGVELQRINNDGVIRIMACGPWTYTGKLKIDTDGTGSTHNDPTHGKDNQTAYIRNGKSLNADTDSYVVVPRWLLNME